jgi:hypothetical protein
VNIRNVTASDILSMLPQSWMREKVSQDDLERIPSPEWREVFHIVVHTKQWEQEIQKGVFDDFPYIPIKGGFFVKVSYAV